MEKINIPRPFQELFGKKTTKVELTLTLVFALLMSAMLMAVTYTEWSQLELWRQILIGLLTVDIAGGVIANFSYGTNVYYRADKKARLLFIAVHVQPVLLALLLGSSFGIAVTVTLYTMAAALAVNYLSGHPAQRIVGAVLMVAGVTVFALGVQNVPELLMVLFSFHIFKVVYAFAVDHYAPR